MQILNSIRAAILEGGVERLTGTVPALVTMGMKLTRAFGEMRLTDESNFPSVDECEKKLAALLKFLHQTIAILQKAEHYSLALHLYLQPLTDPASLVGMEMLAYEFIVQAFSIYEDYISESREQISLLLQMIGTVHAASNTGLFSNDNYDTLATKLTLYSSKLLKKPDQCRMVYRCAHLFWSRPMADSDRQQIHRMLLAESGETAEDRWFYRDGKRVLECLQKSLKIADACMDSLVNVELFVEILRQYVYFYQQGNTIITLKYVNGLVDLIYSNMLALHSDPTLKASAKPAQAVAKVDESNPDSPAAPRIYPAGIAHDSALFI